MDSWHKLAQLIRLSLAEDETSLPHTGEREKKVMVPIYRRQCWVTVCNRVNKSNINFSANTLTVCQATGNLNI